MNTLELAAHAGITYRQIDHWVRAGYLLPANPQPGSGIPRDFLPAEVAVTVRMAHLVAAGLYLPVAHQIARGDRPAATKLLRAIQESVPELFGQAVTTSHEGYL